MVQTSLTTWLKAVQPNSNDIVPSSKILNSPRSAGDASIRQREHLNLLAVASASQDIAEFEEGDLTSEEREEPKSLVSRVPALPPNATLSTIDSETLPSFRRMTTLLLAVPYPDKFFKEILSDEIVSSISMIALWSDLSSKQPALPRVVSGIRCRLLSTSQLLPSSKDGQAPTLYISTITTLAPFRGHGLASALLRRVTARAIRDYGVTSVTAHMWEANEEAREWYSKHGFTEMCFEANYYRKLRPSGAFTLLKRIGPRDLLDEVAD